MERMVNGNFKSESFEEYAEHSLTHDDVEFPEFSPNHAIFERLGLVVGE